MDNLFIQATAKSPAIELDSLTGNLKIKGRLIPEDSDKFWIPVQKWVENYAKQPAAKTSFVFDIEYMNITSSKYILNCLYALNEVYLKEENVEVIWRFKKDDVDVKEIGEDFAFMVKIPFEFCPYSEVEFAMAM
ncbi:DUF1987 domain-containing protein [Lishizhenia sp.]|uniref:DUF1987 domain-containing protein n=1 Tax=Lishizhenia sp. TaxID=2497594 RepID=UPI00299DA55F|nr:DUF1987 domain-containing protein [Lishizhenia sp.]MDX1446891.1 DUF1987 domain-containing protein [Lishizhenia sp.]